MPFLDTAFWIEIIPETLAIFLPTVLCTAFICWWAWRRGRENREVFADAPIPAAASDQALQERKALEHELQLAQANVTNLQEEVQVLKLELAESSNPQAGDGQELQRANHALAQAMDELKRMENERDGYGQEIQALRAELTQVRAEAEERKQQVNVVADSEDNEKVKELTEALRESEYQVSRLSTELQLLRTIRTEFEALRNDNRDLEADLQALQEQKLELESEAGAFLNRAKDAKERQIESERHLAQVRDELSKVREELGATREELGKSRGELDKALQELEQARATKAEITERVALPEVTPHSPEPVVDEEAHPVRERDALTEIEGISPGLESKLNDFGVYQWRQIADWQEDDIQSLSDQLGFQDRIHRDRWVEQAQKLIGDQSDPKEQAPEPAAELEDVVEQPPSSDEDQGHPSLFSLFDSPPTVDEPDDEEVIEKTAPRMETSASEEHGDLLETDPKLGNVYKRPPSQIDDLTRVKGIARVIEGRLHEIGIFRYKQIVQWDESHMSAFAKQLGFGDRIQRDRWREQCQELHEEKYGERLTIPEGSVLDF